MIKRLAMGGIAMSVMLATAPVAVANEVTEWRKLITQSGANAR